MVRNIRVPWNLDGIRTLQTCREAGRQGGFCGGHEATVIERRLACMTSQKISKKDFLALCRGNPVKDGFFTYRCIILLISDSQLMTGAP